MEKHLLITSTSVYYMGVLKIMTIMINSYFAASFYCSQMFLHVLLCYHKREVETYQ